MTKAKSKSKGGHTQKAGMSTMFKVLIGLAIVMVLGLLFYFFGGGSGSSSSAPVSNYKMYMAYGLPQTAKALQTPINNSDQLIVDYHTPKGSTTGKTLNQNNLASLKKYCLDVCDKDTDCFGVQLSPDGACFKLTKDDLALQGEERNDATTLVKTTVKGFRPNPPGEYQPFIAPPPSS